MASGKALAVYGRSGQASATAKPGTLELDL
jgi:hypothetical protein